jgi:integrase
MEGKMAKITGNTKKRKENVSQETQPKKQRNIINQGEYSDVLLKGESLRADGMFVYRPPKSEYDGILKEKPNPIYATSLDDLREKEEAFRSNIKVYQTNRDAKITVAQAYDRWLSLKRNVQENTLRNYIYSFENHVRNSKLGRSYVIDVRKSDVMAFYNGLLDRKSMGQESLHTIQSCLSQVFNFCVEDRIIPAPAPTAGALDHLRNSNVISRGPKRGALTVPEQYTFLTYLKEDPSNRKWARIFFVLLGTGMRIGELTGLQWNCVDFENGIIHVRNNLVYFPHKKTTDNNGNKCYYEMHRLKSTASRRDIPMFGFVREMLLEEKKWQEETGKHCKTPVIGTDGTVYQDFCFFNRFYRPYDAGALTDKVLTRLVRNCNIMLSEGKIKNGTVVPNFGCHVLRHTAATRLIELGISPVVVQAFLGHADVTTTMQIYVNVTESFKMREFGMAKDKNVPNIFEDALKENGIFPRANSNILQGYLPQSKAASLIPGVQKIESGVQNS